MREQYRYDTSTGKITSAMLVAQHLGAIFNKDWDMEHADMKIQPGCVQNQIL